jgi:hypothetical protein
MITAAQCRAARAFKIGSEAHAKFVAEHHARRVQRTKDLIERTRAKAIEHGPDSFWAEMLAEMVSKP